MSSRMLMERSFAPCVTVVPSGFLAESILQDAGRAYVNPVQLLLTVVLAFALLGQSSKVSMNIGKFQLNLQPPGTPAGETIAKTVEKLDVFGLLSHQLEQAGRTKDVNSKSAEEKFHHELKTFGTALSLGNVIL